MSNKTTIIMTGDSFLTRRLPEKGYEGFDELQDIIAEHEVRFNNLEITTHDSEGYPAAFSGGTWAMAEPEVLDSLQRFGFNVYNTANNHSCDYSHGGLMATIKHLKERDMAFSGTGENLAMATAPAYVDASDARVAMIGVCATFHDSDIAGNQSRKISGRPGLNPLRHKKICHIEKKYFDVLEQIAEETHMNAEKMQSIKNGYELPFPEGKMNFADMSFECDTVNELHTIPNEKDMERILSEVTEAKRQAEYVMVSIHSHEFAGTSMLNPAEFLCTFSRACIDAGADIIIGHGPHELRGIEIYKNKPIFYSLGNFIFQTETVKLQPAEAYENKNMPHDTQVGAYMNSRSKDGTRGYVVQENIWRSVMASATVEDGEITEIRLYPITLGLGEKRSKIGFPKLTHNNEVLKYLAELSAPFGTELIVEDEVATVVLKK